MSTDKESSPISKSNEILKGSEEVMNKFMETTMDLAKLLSSLPHSEESYDSFHVKFREVFESKKSWEASRLKFLDDLQRFVDSDSFSQEAFNSAFSPVEKRKAYLNGLIDGAFLMLMQWAMACGKMDGIGEIEEWRKRTEEEDPTFPYIM